ncbi:hypothetical protein J0X19_22860 [Hymenobacter sp. BT186]|uniref:PKD domain-containing protein n=1 Tax=Hymenobacter telluris TaxID=2816474 RepID=A0A939JBD7_9BACT|nr:hypothetical protein [Hymenobacter telluris]MBO0360819.1 hypothetical protein [Hymenobacter telluris]MBW3376848.1 hypothetical protein [Hymenobacter norwichensis]
MTILRFKHALILSAALLTISSKVAAQNNSSLSAMAVPSLNVTMNSSGQAIVTAAAINSGSSTATSCGSVTLSLLKDGAPADTVSIIGNEYYNGDINTLDGPTLTAPANSVFIQVNFASYGIPLASSNGYTINPGCHAANSQSYVESRLLGRNTASFADIDVYEVFGDPCGGQRKQLIVTASSAMSEVVFTTTGPHTVTLIATDACGNISTAATTSINVLPADSNPSLSLDDQLRLEPSADASGRIYSLVSKTRPSGFEVDEDGVARTGTYRHGDGTTFELVRNQLIIRGSRAPHAVKILH